MKMSTEKTIQSILVTGASGYVGQHLLEYLCQTEPPASIAKREIVAWSSTSSTLAPTPCMAKGVTMEGGIIEAVDLTNSVSVTEALARLSSPVHVVVHLAAISGLQACQDDPVRALATNHPTILWEALPNTTRVIAMSTDQVYDGFHPPYSEADASSETLSPINVYGETKLAMEQGLMELFSPQQCVILRSSLILGSPAVHSKKQSFVQFLETQLLEKKETNVFTDEYRSVVSVTNVVQVISYFLEHNKESPGIYNMGGSESVNRWDIALAVHRQLWGDDDHETPSNLHGIERSKLPKTPNAAPSPPNITMEIGKLQTLLQSAGIQLWGLNDTIHHCNLSRPQL